MGDALLDRLPNLRLDEAQECNVVGLALPGHVSCPDANIGPIL